MKSLKGKTVLISGAANGLGESLTLELAKAGCQVAALDKDEEGLKKLSKRLAEDSIKHLILKRDLLETEKLKNLPELVASSLGPVDILINNAGVSVHGPFSSQSHEDIDWITSINYLSAIHLTRIFIPDLEKRSEAHIVNVSSAAGLQGFPFRSSYSASKFALRGFSEALRAEYHGTGIGVSCVHPGPIRTDMPLRSRIHEEKQREKEILYMQDSGQDPDKIARKIISAIIKNKAIVLCSSQAYSVAWAKRFMPARLSDWIGRYKDRLPI